MVGRNGSASSVLKPTCGPCDVCRRCLSNVLAGLQREHKEAVFAKIKEWNSGSSSSSGGEDRWSGGQEEELKKLRAQVALPRQQHGVWDGQDAQGALTRGGSGLDEDSKMGGRDGLQEKVYQQKKSLQRQLRDIEKFASMDPVFCDRQKEFWK